jgi:hypothetical protein
MSIDILRPAANEDNYSVNNDGGNGYICARATIDSGWALIPGYAAVFADLSNIPDGSNSTPGIADGAAPYVYFDNVPGATTGAAPNYLAVWDSAFAQRQIQTFYGLNAGVTECGGGSEGYGRSLVNGLYGNVNKDSCQCSKRSYSLAGPTPLWNLHLVPGDQPSDECASGDWRYFGRNWLLQLDQSGLSKCIWKNKEIYNGAVPNIQLTAEKLPSLQWMFTLAFTLQQSGQITNYKRCAGGFLTAITLFQDPKNFDRNANPPSWTPGNRNMPLSLTIRPG